MARMNNKVMELIKALEEALPEGEIVVVGNGDHLTEAHKEWLRSLIDDPIDTEDPIVDCEEDEEDEDTCDDCPLRAECYPYDDEEYENAAYARGYADAMAEVQKTADEAYDYGKEDAEAEMDEETMALVKLIKLMREAFGN